MAQTSLISLSSVQTSLLPLARGTAADSRSDICSAEGSMRAPPKALINGETSQMKAQFRCLPAVVVKCMTPVWGCV